MSAYTILLSDATKARVLRYMQASVKSMGVYLQQELRGFSGRKDGPSFEEFLEALLNTKKTTIFAESAVSGDGSDWTKEELSILGDISMATDEVDVYDNGRHTDPWVYAKPIKGTLLFTPGALLAARRGFRPADMDVVYRVGGLPLDEAGVPDQTLLGEIDQCALTELYRRRLVPVLRYASAQANRYGQRAVVTIPGLGCGQFAGDFRGRMAPFLLTALKGVLEEYHTRLSGIELIHFDPYGECENESCVFGGLVLNVRPLCKGNLDTPQLCPPTAYLPSEQGGGSRKDLRLFSVVAWDHVSWPGNDFYAGCRATDDGVKAAATSSMRCFTGIEGVYSEVSNEYTPPKLDPLWPSPTWGSLVKEKKLRLRANKGNIEVIEL